MRETDYRFKLLYALGMIMIVSGHVPGGGAISIFGNWFPYYGVHLPLFAFCAGYFFKPQSIDNTGNYIKKKVKKLIIPLYIYTVVYGIIVQILKSMGFAMGEDI